MVSRSGCKSVRVWKEITYSQWNLISSAKYAADMITQFWEVERNGHDPTGLLIFVCSVSRDSRPPWPIRKNSSTAYERISPQSRVSRPKPSRVKIGSKRLHRRATVKYCSFVDLWFPRRNGDLGLSLREVNRHAPYA
ncbi:unnamed protein product [Calypogeia fissa]